MTENLSTNPKTVSFYANTNVPFLVLSLNTWESFLSVSIVLRCSKRTSRVSVFPWCFVVCVFFSFYRLFTIGPGCLGLLCCKVNNFGSQNLLKSVSLRLLHVFI